MNLNAAEIVKRIRDDILLWDESWDASRQEGNEKLSIIDVRLRGNVLCEIIVRVFPMSLDGWGE